MQKSSKLILLTLAMALFVTGGCSKTVERRVPVMVPTAVYTPCPKPKLMSAGNPPDLPIDNVSTATPIDVAANTWKATVLILQGYIARLRTEIEDTHSALDECTKER